MNLTKEKIQDGKDTKYHFYNNTFLQVLFESNKYYNKKKKKK